MTKTMFRKYNTGLLVPRACAWCGQLTEPDKKFLQCAGCKLARYCSPVCQRDHWRDIFDGHKITCNRASKAKFYKKPDAEADICKKIQDRLWRLQGHTKLPGLLPSGECTITSGHQKGPVKVVVDFVDGTARTLVITDEPGIRPVTVTLTMEDPRRHKKYRFQTQADCARWSMGNALLVQDALGWSKGRSLVHGQSGRLTRGLSEMNIRCFVTALLNKFNEDLIWE